MGSLLVPALLLIGWSLFWCGHRRIHSEFFGMAGSTVRRRLLAGSGILSGVLAFAIAVDQRGAAAGAIWWAAWLCGTALLWALAAAMVRPRTALIVCASIAMLMTAVALIR